MCRVWNSLSVELVHVTSVEAFKRNLDKIIHRIPTLLLPYESLPLPSLTLQLPYLPPTPPSLPHSPINLSLSHHSPHSLTRANLFSLLSLIYLSVPWRNGRGVFILMEKRRTEPTGGAVYTHGLICQPVIYSRSSETLEPLPCSRYLQ